MALTPQYSDAAVNAMAEALAALLNNGYLRIYDGPQPTTANEAITAENHLLAELRFAADAFIDAVAGVSASNPVTQDSSANATGIAEWGRALKSDGTTVVMDGSAGLTDANWLINDDNIIIGGTVSCSGVVLSVSTGGEYIPE